MNRSLRGVRVLALVALLSVASACGGDGSSSGGDPCILDDAAVAEAVDGIEITGHEAVDGGILQYCEYVGDREGYSLTVQIGYVTDAEHGQAAYEIMLRENEENDGGYVSDVMEAAADGSEAWGRADNGAYVFARYDQNGFQSNGNTQALRALEAYNAAL